MLLFFLLQSIASPDIEFRADVRAKSVTVERRGDATLEVRADPDGGSMVKVDAPPASSTLRNVTIVVDAKAVLAPTNSAVTTPPGPDKVESETGREK